MNIVSTTSAVARTAAPLAAPAPVAIDYAQAIHQAATQLLPLLEQGNPVTTSALRATMTESFGGTDAEGLWVWKDAYEALELAEGLILRRSRVMNDYRAELIGFTDAMVPRLKALGLISEIISWKLRLFIPTSAQGSAILATLLDRHALIGMSERAASA